MAQYASTTDLASVGLPAVALSGVPLAQQDEFLSQAGGLIDTYLQSQYTLPITGSTGPPNTYPGSLVRCNITLACYELLTFRRYNPDEYDQNWRRKYEDAIKWLTSLAKGEVSLLPGDDATPTLHEGAPRVFSFGSPRVNAGPEANKRRGW